MGGKQPNLSTQPSEAFWELPNLRALNLVRSGIKLFPECVEKLKSLKYLYIDVTNIPDSFGSAIDFQLELANRCHSLTSIFLMRIVKEEHQNKEELKWQEIRSVDIVYQRKTNEDFPDHFELSSSMKSIRLALTWNAARQRTKIAKNTPGLWPHILCNPIGAFNEVEQDVRKFGKINENWNGDIPQETYEWDDEKDALYQLLLQNHHELLIHRDPSRYRYPRRRRRPPEYRR